MKLMPVFIKLALKMTGLLQPQLQRTTWSKLISRCFCLKTCTCFFFVRYLCPTVPCRNTLAEINILFRNTFEIFKYWNSYA